ncbi:MAG TPA: DUF983 domain-containing protein [Thermoanaerobaculia bacterium]|nr:DUF983 domain-containing protein [Thermoanaerobaculia bacterium]
MTKRPRVRDVLRRGLKRRCPRCGEGPLFVRGIRVHERCSACGLHFQRNHGDTWIWVILLDRLPIAAAIVAIYFGFSITTWAHALGFVIALLVPLIATVRERQGLAIALDFLTRVYLPDPSDEIHAA